MKCLPLTVMKETQLGEYKSKMFRTWHLLPFLEKEKKQKQKISSKITACWMVRMEFGNSRRDFSNSMFSVRFFLVNGKMLPTEKLGSQFSLSKGFFFCYKCLIDQRSLIGWWKRRRVRDEMLRIAIQSFFFRQHTLNLKSRNRFTNGKKRFFLF